MKQAAHRLQSEVRGLCCAEEAVALRREVGAVVGGEDPVSFDLPSHMTVVLASGDLRPEAVMEAVSRTGTQAEVRPVEGRAVPPPSFWQR